MAILAAVKTVTDSATVPLGTSGVTDIDIPIAIPSSSRAISAGFHASVSGVALTNSFLDSSASTWRMGFRAPATTDPSVTITVTVTVISVE